MKSSSPEAGWRGPAPRAAFAPLPAAAPTGRDRPGWGAGFASGYGAGYAEGLRLATARSADAEQVRTAHHESERARERDSAARVTARLTAAADELASRSVGAADELVELVAGCATELAGAVVGTAAGTPEAVAFRLRRALAVLHGPDGGGRAVPTARLHPTDLTLLREAADQAGARLAPDPTLARGDVVVSDGVTTVTDLVATAVAEVTRAMTDPAELADRNDPTDRNEPGSTS